MEVEASHSVRSAVSEAALEQDLEDLKDLLLEYDRSLNHKLSRGEKLSPDDKRARSRIVRRLNRTRRQLYRLRKGTVQQPIKRITFRVTQEEYSHLQIIAQQEGLSLSAYIKTQLFPEKRGSSDKQG